MEAYVHMTGYVGGEVDVRQHSVATASFRLACTPRINRGGDWSDGETTWLTVTCFRSLAENAASSIGKGDPVVVVGRLRTQVWSKDGVQQERLVLEALTVGHDLSRGTSAFARSERSTAAGERDPEAPAVLEGGSPAGGDGSDHEPGEAREDRRAA